MATAHETPKRIGLPALAGLLGGGSPLGGKRALVLAAVLGLLAGAVGFFALRAREREVRAGWALTEVLVAAGDLPAGELLDADRIARRQIPERFVTTSVLRPDHAEVVLGQRLAVPVQAGDPLLWTHLEARHGPDRLAASVQPRGRAVTIAVSDTSSVGNFVRPNDHVDVLGTFRDHGGGEAATTTVLENVIVLATGAATGHRGAPADGYAHVSLLVLPEEAELLVLAQELGSLHLVLRNPDDLEIRGERARITATQLLTGEKRESLEKLRRQTIQVIRGVGSTAEAAR